MKIIRLACLFFGLVTLAACQTTSLTPATSDQVVTQISGVWKGSFINDKGSRFPMTFNIKGRHGSIAGDAHIPDSSFDKRPKLSGHYAGSKITITTSSDFTYDLTMSVSEDGTYWLKGPASGANSGRAELKRQ